MVETYETLEGSITFRAGNTTRSVGAGDDVAIVGGYNASVADSQVTPGETTTLTTPTAAAQLFGQESELARLVDLAVGNGAGTVQAVPVPEMENTESVSSTDAGTLDYLPLDPTVHPEHSITVTDTSDGSDVAVDIVYGSVTAPDSGFAVNPVTGEWAAASASSYDISYTYGDYETAINTAVRETVRVVIVASESASHAVSLQTTLTAEAANFNLKLGVIGASPSVEPGDTISQASRRLVKVTPSRGDGASGAVRTVGAVGGMIADRPIGASGSITFDTIGGLTELSEQYTISEAKAFEQRTAITREFEVAEGVTTAEQVPLRPIHVTEILDTVGLSVFETARSFGGSGLRQRTPSVIAGTIRRVLSRFASGGNPLLASVGGGQPYQVTVTASESGSVDAAVTVNPIDIVDDVNLTVTSGDVIDFAVSA